MRGAGWLFRFDTMFVRLFLAMATIMVAVHVLGLTVIERVFPRPERHPPHLRADDANSKTAPGSTHALAPRPAPDWGRGEPRDIGRPPGPDFAPGSSRKPEGDRPPPPEGRRGPPPFWAHVGMWMQLATIFLASWVGARLLSRPIRQLAEGAGRLAQDVHVVHIDETSGPAEARHAARVFNQMQDRIRSQMARQSRFLAAVSHDLRTPLTRMSLRIEQIGNRGPHAALGEGDDDVRHRLRQDLAEMNGLIDATLYYLRERDGAAGPRQRVDINALLQALVDDACEVGQDVALAGEAEPMLAYPSELRRAVVNLVENADRYGGGARIDLVDAPTQLTIDICDDGPGIPTAELDRVLEPFYRLESSRSRATGGVGMGLSIAADIVGLHGGTLSLTNRPEGGLRARIVLPRV